MWKQIFLQHKEWEGIYFYFRNRIKFKLWTISVNMHPDGMVKGLFMDDKAKFDVEGLYAIRQLVMLIMP